MRKFTKVGFLITTTAATMILLSGCGFGGEQAVNQKKEENLNPPQDITVTQGDKSVDKTQVSDPTASSNDQAQAQEMVSRQLYLLDKNGYVVPQTVQVPKTKEVAKQSLEFLVNGGPVTELLPNGFKAVLPEGTVINGVNLKEDGTLITDFSKEFANYKAEDELKILQAITWTLTQFDSVKKVEIRINGVEQPFMPVDGTPIEDGYSRANGINFDSGDVFDMTESKAVTLYFLDQIGDNTYYVPVTRRVDSKTEDGNKNLSTVVNELIKGPSVSSNLMSEFNSDMKLLDEPKYEDGTVTLNFNEAVRNGLEGTAISNNILNPLVLSLTEQEGVDSVVIQINGEQKVFNEAGKELTKPVTRPNVVNVGSF